MRSTAKICFSTRKFNARLHSILWICDCNAWGITQRFAGSVSWGALQKKVTNLSENACGILGWELSVLV
jgi:hypothetical protein